MKKLPKVMKVAPMTVVHTAYEKNEPVVTTSATEAIVHVPKKLRPTDSRGGLVSVGRNGLIQTHGLAINTGFSTAIFLVPITSRGKMGHCEIALPRDSLFLRTVAQCLHAVADGLEEKK